MKKKRKHDGKYGRGNDYRDTQMKIFIEAKDRGLDLRVKIDCCVTVNWSQPTGGSEDSP